MSPQKPPTPPDLCTNPVARDLWWVASSTPMMTDVERLPQLSAERQDLLRDHVLPAVRALEAMSTEDALAAVGATGWRVGHYFEALVGHWIQALPGWTLLAANHPVRHEKQTLGAYDFILRNSEGQVEHWEVAVKFYLRRDLGSEWRSWVGPNQRDRLDKKVNRMRDHQLVLSRREVGLAALEPLGVSEIHRRVALLKGCFFTEWGRASTGPEGATEDAQGRWTDESQLTELARAFPQSRWMRRDKPFWLAPLEGLSFDLDAGGLPDALRRPEMWSRLEQQTSGDWREAERWFLVPADWRDRR